VPSLLRRRPSRVGGRDFTLVWWGEAVSALGSSMSAVALPLLVLSLGGTAAEAGLVGFAEALPRFATALPSGVLVDRFDRRRVLIVCDAGRGAAMALLLTGLFAGHLPIALLALVALVDGSLYTAAYIAERAVVRDLVEPARLPDAVARMEARLYAVLIAGPALGGLLFGFARSLPFVLDAVSYGAAAVAVAAVRTPLNAHVVDRAPSTAVRLHDGITWIWRSAFLRASALLIAGVMPLYSAVFLFAVLLAHGRGDSAFAIGVMYGIVGVGGLLGAVLVTRLRRLAGRRAVLIQQTVLATCVGLLALAPGAVVVGLLLAIGELLSPVVVSALQGYRLATTPAELQGRVQAASMLITRSFMWVGPLVAGTAYTLVGPTATALGLAGWATLLAVAILVTPSLRRLPD
jgi:MFS family permease